MTIDLFADIETEVKLPLGLKIPTMDGYSCEPKLFGAVQGWHIVIPQGEILYFPQFFSQKVADRALSFLLENSTGHKPDQLDDATATAAAVRPEQQRQQCQALNGTKR